MIWHPDRLALWPSDMFDSRHIQTVKFLSGLSTVRKFVNLPMGFFYFGDVLTFSGWFAIIIACI